MNGERVEVVEGEGEGRGGKGERGCEGGLSEVCGSFWEWRGVGLEEDER